jgi:filamentous hemagglutinin family protein
MTGSKFVIRALAAATACAVLCPAPGAAQVVTDGTLGTATALQGPDFRIDAALGQARGGNLFHSFAQFVLANGQSATFLGPGSILNVIARVTGPDASRIDGTVGTSGMPSANLWLVNPNGVVFGADASLDVPGSVYVTSADYLALGGGAGRFDAADPSRSVLVSAPPSAFGFLDGPIGDIEINGARLARPSGTQVALVGGDVRIADGAIVAPSGKVQIGAVASRGEATIDAGGTIAYDGFAAMGDVAISNSPSAVNEGIDNIDVSSVRSTTGPGGGSVLIRGGRFVLSSGSIVADNLASAPGGRIDMAMTESIAIGGQSLVNISSRAAGGVDGIRMDAPRIAVSGRSEIRSEARGTGDGGTISITGREISFSEDAAVSTSAFLEGGDGGSVRIAATESLEFSDNVFIQSVTRGDGDAGSIDLSAGDIRILDRASILALAFLGSSGDGGAITITAAGELDFFGTGTGLPRSENALISTSANGSGTGGNVDIRAGTLAIGALALVESRSRGAGDAGNVRIEAGDTRIDGGAGINSRSEGSGNGGTLDLRLGAFTLAGGATLSAEALGTGLAGDIAVSAASTSLQDSSITTAAAISDGGNIALDPGDLFLLDNALIETSVRSGVGDGGNIRIGNAAATPEFLVARGSRIQANAFGGDGGNIDVTVDYLVLDAYSTIEASSQLGVDGVITFANPEVDVATLVAPPAAVLGSGETIATTACERSGRPGSRLVVAPGGQPVPSVPCTNDGP